MFTALAAASLLSFQGFSGLPEIRHVPTLTYLDRSGVVIGVRGGRDGPVVDIAKLPPYVPAAFVSVEDRRFFEHSGFDPMGMARAVVTDLARGRTAQGASTITQQLARNLYLSNDQTLERKAQELIYAVQLEQKYSKPQILSLYMSRVYFGSGAYGIEAASRRFFAKPASRLTLREAATLAGILKNPAGYSPVNEPERSAERTAIVLQTMVETGAITKAQMARALATRPKVQKSDPAGPSQYFVDWTDGQVRKLLGGQVTADVVVETTLDAALEADAQAATQGIMAKAVKAGVQQAAMVAMAGQGRVRALIGGVDYQASSYNRVTQARRQAGSSWKPFVYLTALEAGRTPDTVVVDEPITIDGWSPRNHTPGFAGPMTLETALAQSVNTVDARMADEVGRPNVARTAQRLGIASAINTDPAMALGTSAVSPLEMAGAYTAFANGGRRTSPYGIERIRVNGRIVYQRRDEGQAQVIANPPLGQLDRMLRTVVASGTATRAAIPGYDLAGNTGTTTDNRDAWFAGFTGGLTAVAWVGRDDNSPMGPGAAGGGPPADLWRRFMVAALPKAGARPIPAGPVAPPSADPNVAPTQASPAADDPVSGLLRPSQPSAQDRPQP
ncbi:penicillin-binding protein 1A [soil metagenome]